MKKWEYHRAVGSPGVIMTSEYLTAMGRDGWELFIHERNGAGLLRDLFIFRRVSDKF